MTKLDGSWHICWVLFLGRSAMYVESGIGLAALSHLLDELVLEIFIPFQVKLVHQSRSFFETYKMNTY
jgi:hypothetical protein